MYLIGLMSGTSVDAIDASLVEINQNDLVVSQYQEYPIPAHIQSQIRSVTAGSSMTTITGLDAVLGHLFADAVNAIISQAGISADQVSAIGCHGQTVLHLPESDYPRTLQIGDPNIIAVKTGITTIADFRRSDMAVGGQGAPLASAFHSWRFRDKSSNRVVLNIGGMANITILPADISQQVSGFDTGPGNALMDDWIQRCLQQDYDQNGEWASSGRYDPDLLAILLDEPYFSSTPPKSTGKDDFNLCWLERRLNGLKTLPEPENVQATLLELTARTISDAVKNTAADTREILLCGGGSHNLSLVRRLQQLLPDQSIVTTELYGVHPDAVEAVTFAWLAMCRLEQIPANLPAVTGATRAVVLGGIYKG